MTKKLSYCVKEYTIQCDMEALTQGGLLILAGILLPAILQEDAFAIYRTMQEGLRSEEPSLLLLASLKLVILNCIRAIPHYIGTFIISASLLVRRGKRHRCFFFNVLFTVSVIALVYRVVDWLYANLKYDFGIPAFLSICAILFLSYFDLFSVNLINRLIILSSMLLGFSWMDVMPGLTPFGFGRGEISIDLKIYAHVVQQESLLTLFANTMCVVFLICAAIQTQMLYKDSRLQKALSREHGMAIELKEVQLEALRMRSYREVQSLVHDLKTPLTTVQGLVGLAELMEDNPQIREYLRKVSDSVTSMSTMISEILYEEHKNNITTRSVMRLVLSHASMAAGQSAIHYSNQCEEALLYGNRIRLSRALINLIDNSLQAVACRGAGQVRIDIRRDEGLIRMEIWDNGTGIGPEELEHIWDVGYSGKNTTGLGLGFTKRVVENHGGKIAVESVKGEYAKFVVLLREVKG